MAARDTASPVVHHTTYCRICPVQCGVVVTTRGDQVLDVRGDPEHPRTKGYTCPKGRALPAFHHHPARLDRPAMGRAGARREVEWSTLVSDLDGRVGEIVAEHGPDAVAVYHGTWSWLDALGRRAAERYLRRLGTRSVYSALTVDAVARSYVAELMGGSSALIPNLDAESVGLTIVVGSNPVVSHGHASALVDPITQLRAIARRAGLWVIDPRRTETARLATRHLAPRPGSDHVLLGHLVREILADGADREYLARHAGGVDALRAAVAPFDRLHTAGATGLDAGQLDELVEAIRTSGRIAVLTGTGTTMSPWGNLTEWLAWALQVVTGSFEKEGGLWFNPGFFMRLDEGRAPKGDGTTRPGPAARPDLGNRFGEHPCAALADEIEAGNVRALFVIGGNPLASLPATTRLRAAFRSLDVLAVADVVDTETTDLATHLIAAAGQLERADTTYYVELFLGEVATQATPAVVPPAAERRPVWWVFDALDRLAAGDALGGVVAAEPTPERAREQLDALGARLGPRGVGLADTAYRHAIEPRPRGWVHEQVLPDGRWRLAPAPLVGQLAQVPTPDRLVAQPRRVVRRMNSALADLPTAAARPNDDAVIMHPDDAAGIGVGDGDEVVVRSAHGQIHARVSVSADVGRGVLSIPHGLREHNVNELTSGEPGAVDPLTGMVHQSGFAVTVTCVEPDEPSGEGAG